MEAPVSYALIQFRLNDKKRPFYYQADPTLSMNPYINQMVLPSVRAWHNNCFDSL